MDESQFWKIIANAKGESGGDREAFAGAIHSELTELPAPEIVVFDSILSAKLAQAYTWKLWGAAYLINGGCSDDGFEYFRCWLISQGKKVYDAAVADPDTLAEIIDPDNDAHECEDLLGVGMRAFKEIACKPLAAPKLGTRPSKPTGENWDFEDLEVTAKQLPKLSNRYKDGGRN